MFPQCFQDKTETSNFINLSSYLLEYGMLKAIRLCYKSENLKLTCFQAEQTGRTKMLTPDYCDNHVCNLRNVVDVNV